MEGTGGNRLEDYSEAVRVRDKPTSALGSKQTSTKLWLTTMLRRLQY